MHDVEMRIKDFSMLEVRRSWPRIGGLIGCILGLLRQLDLL